MLILVTIQAIALCMPTIKNLETVICNLKQECFILSDWFYYLISFMTTIHGSELRKVSLHVVWRQGE